MEVLILGTGCARCGALEALVEREVAGLRDRPAVRKVSSIAEMLRYEITAMPALVIDGEVRCAGRLPTAAEVRAWFGGRGEAAT